MKVEISITEIQQFLQEKYQVKVDIKSNGDNILEVCYIDTVLISVKQIQDNKVFLVYEVSGLVDLIAKVAKIFLKKKLKNIPITWDARTREITVDFKKIHAFHNLIKFSNLSEIHFIRDSVLFVLTPVPPVII